MSEPTLMIVTGLPCTGKTWLAQRLAARLRLPLFTKDQVKEVLFDTLGAGDRAWSRRLGVASTAVLFAVVESTLAAGRSCIAESNFHPELDGARLRALQARIPFAVAQVLCVADGQTLWARYQRRVQEGARHPGHLDHVLVEELRPQLLGGRLAPLPAGGALIEVDTTDFAVVDDAAIAARLSQMLRTEG
ncbi:MAG TPA: AAA family ATPase [Roseiflexaceae bacterium]|nr:AAA family ATPase [Roseiflexaceae bacterium]